MIKSFLILFLFLTILWVTKSSYKQGAITTRYEAEAINNKTDNDKVSKADFLKDFNAFRDALSLADKEKVKKYIAFPITETSAEGKLYVKYTKANYSDKFKEIFPEKLTKVFTEININELAREKKTKTRTFNDGDALFYYGMASISKDRKNLEIYIPTNQIIFNEEGTVKTEKLFSNVTYLFKINRNTLRLISIKNNS